MPLKKVDGWLHRLAEALEKSSIVRVLDVVAKFGIVVAVIFYFFERDERQQQRELMAWNAIASARQTEAAGGVKSALELLVRNGVVLDGIDLENAYLAGADLSGASLQEALLNEADLSHANLSGANLSGSRLVHVNLSSANLREADLTNVELQAVDLSGVDLTGARIGGGIITGLQLDNIRGLPGCADLPREANWPDNPSMKSESSWHRAAQMAGRCPPNPDK